MIEISQLPIVDRALIFAAKAHEYQKRKYTYEPYIVHPIAVAGRLRRSLLLDSDIDTPYRAHVVAAAYLHDVLEDTSVTSDIMRQEFGNDITDLVLEVTDVSRPEDGNRGTRKRIDREHLAMSSYAGASIKLADMIDNTMTIVNHDPDFAKVYMSEKSMLVPLLKHGNRWLYREASELLDSYYRTV